MHRRKWKMPYETSAGENREALFWLSRDTGCSPSKLLSWLTLRWCAPSLSLWIVSDGSPREVIISILFKLVPFYRRSPGQNKWLRPWHSLRLAERENNIPHSRSRDSNGSVNMCINDAAVSPRRCSPPLHNRHPSGDMSHCLHRAQSAIFIFINGF